MDRWDESDSVKSKAEWTAKIDDVKSKIATELSANSISSFFRKHFAEMDENKDGILCSVEVQAARRELGSLTPAEKKIMNPGRGDANELDSLLGSISTTDPSANHGEISMQTLDCFDMQAAVRNKVQDKFRKEADVLQDFLNGRFDNLAKAHDGDYVTMEELQKLRTSPLGSGRLVAEIIQTYQAEIPKFHEKNKSKLSANQVSIDDMKELGFFLNEKARRIEGVNLAEKNVQYSSLVDIQIMDDIMQSKGWSWK